MENKEIIQKTIDTLILQIEMVSNKCQLETNRKNSRVNILEYSSTILQLSRTLSELMLIQRALETNNADLMQMIHGRLR